MLTGLTHFVTVHIDGDPVLILPPEDQVGTDDVSGFQQCVLCATIGINQHLQNFLSELPKIFSKHTSKVLILGENTKRGSKVIHFGIQLMINLINPLMIAIRD